MADGYFGPANGIDTKDYLLMMEGSTPVARPERLPGHTLTNGNVNLSDALRITRVELSRGRIRTFTITKRAAEEQGRTYDIGFPSGAIYTPALRAAQRPGCSRTFFMKYLCPEDRRFEHVRILPNGVLSPPVPTGDLITVEDVTPITETSTLETSTQETLFILGYDPVYSVSSTNIGAIAFLTAECPGCADVPGLALIAAGGDGDGATTVVRTDDRFTNVTNPTAGGSDHYATGIFTDGGLVVMTFADETTPAGGTGAVAGSIAISNNGGQSFVAVSGISLPVYGVDRLGGTLIAVGGTGAGAGKIYYSQDEGGSWTEFTGTTTVAEAFTAISADNEVGAAYIVGEAASLFKVTVPGTAVILADLSNNLPGSPTALSAVKVLGPNHIMVGGASGYLAESFDGGANWVQLAVAGANAVGAIGGNRFRTLVGAAGVLWERSPLNDFGWSQVATESGVAISGNIRSIAMNADGDYNLFAIVTSNGQFLMGKSFAPNS